MRKKDAVIADREEALKLACDSLSDTLKRWLVHEYVSLHNNWQRRRDLDQGELFVMVQNLHLLVLLFVIFIVFVFLLNIII